MFTRIFRRQKEDLVQDIAPKASAMVPDHIRKSMAKEIKQFLKEQQDY